MSGIELFLDCAALPDRDDYEIISCSLSEAVSRPTRATVELQSPALLDPKALLDKSLSLQASHEVPMRLWDFVIEAVRYAGSRNEYHRYYLELSHPLALLARRFDVRAFQKKTLRKIVEELLAPAGISPPDIAWKVDEDPERDYIVQYRESDLAFFERLLLEEGVNYLTTHIEGKPALLIADAVGDIERPDLGELQLIDGSHGEGVTDFDVESSIESEIFSTSDYNYLTANAEMYNSVSTAESPVAEWYEYPGGYLDPQRGKTLAQRRAEARLSRQDSATGRAENVLFEPGKYFSLTKIGEDSAQWLLVEVSHRWVLRSDGTQATDDGSYSNAFRSVPFVDYYRQVAERLPRTVEGPVGAVVTTQGGEEIYTEQFGEAKARFFWDRLNPLTDEASCWVRVIQIPIGGSLAVARRDWEILLRHLHGDPNRPILVSRMDNAGHPAPYAYPAAGTGLAWKTLASPGAAKINEFSMEDAAGKQGFNMTAGTDYSCEVNNNKTEKVTVNEEAKTDVDHTSTVTADQKTTIGATWTKTVSADAGVTVNADRTLSVGAAETVTVSGNLSEKVIGSDTETVGATYMALAGMNVSRTSKGSQSLTVGGALITAAGLSVSVAVGGSKQETIGGAKILAAGGTITESVVGGFSMIVGGVIVNAAGGNCIASSTAASTVKIGGVGLISGGKQVQVSAKKITIEVGAAAALLGGGGIMALTAGSASFVGMVTIKASGKLKIKGAPNLPG